jgi:hypothetical protein
MSLRHGISFLIFESVEKDLNYLLEYSNMILCTFFVKLLPGGRRGPDKHLNHEHHIASSPKNWSALRHL